MDAFIINIAVALLCITGGYLIAVKQKRGLIAGWDESKFLILKHMQNGFAFLC